MKIMVYYLAISRHGESTVPAKLAELQKEFPGIKIKVIAAYGASYDRIEVIDLYPPVYPSIPSYVATMPNGYYQPQPFGTYTTNGYGTCVTGAAGGGGAQYNPVDGTGKTIAPK